MSIFWVNCHIYFLWGNFRKQQPCNQITKKGKQQQTRTVNTFLISVYAFLFRAFLYNHCYQKHIEKKK